jgi:NAD+ kinase
MRVALYGRLLESTNVPYVQQLIDTLQTFGVELVVYKKFLPHLEGKVELPKEVATFKTHEDLIHQVDYLLSLGGDGTLLDTVALIRDSNIPVMGINTGRLGFLSSVSKEEIYRAIRALVDHDIDLEEKPLVQITANKPLFSGDNFALNEFSINKRDIASMVVIHAYLNEQYLNSYWCDGLIIATPTGSTAYSLSCGGPVILPGSKSFAITPVAPHHLTVRPVIVPDDTVITLELEGHHDSFLCSLDSRSTIIDSSYRLTIQKERFHLRLARLHEADFLSTLRNKLLWGFDKRNK